MKNYLLELAKELNQVTRMGSENDDPEGTRYIQMSDTLSRKTESAISELGCEINKILDWYEQNKTIKDDDPFNRCRCPVCDSYWVNGFGELHDDNCWIPSLKRVAFIEREEVNP
jgi:hypothetical protein